MFRGRADSSTRSRLGSHDPCAQSLRKQDTDRRPHECHRPYEVLSIDRILEQNVDADGMAAKVDLLRIGADVERAGARPLAVL